jgi:hypothetical protein
MSNAEDGFKEIVMGKQNAKKTYKDTYRHILKTVKTYENGIGRFLVKQGKVSVWG